MNESGTFFDKRTEHFFLIFMKEIKPKHTLKKIIEHFFLSFFYFLLKHHFSKKEREKRRSSKCFSNSVPVHFPKLLSFMKYSENACTCTQMQLHQTINKYHDNSKNSNDKNYYNNPAHNS